MSIYEILIYASISIFDNECNHLEKKLINTHFIIWLKTSEIKCEKFI